MVGCHEEPPAFSKTQHRHGLWTTIGKVAGVNGLEEVRLGAEVFACPDEPTGRRPLSVPQAVERIGADLNVVRDTNDRVWRSVQKLGAVPGAGLLHA